MDSMDESTMDSTTDRYEDLLSVHLFVPAVLHHLLHSSGGIIAFSVLFLFFPLEKSSLALWLGSKQVCLKSILSAYYKVILIR